MANGKLVSGLRDATNKPPENGGYMQPGRDAGIPAALRHSVSRSLNEHVPAHQATSHFSQAKKLLQGTKRVSRKRITSVEIEAMVALPIYSASISILARKGLSAMELNGWDVLVDAAHELTFLAEAQARNESFVVTRVSSGVSVEQIEIAIQRARKSMPKGGQRAELRVLRIPAMHFSAIWIHRVSRSKDDGIIPFTANFVGLRLQRLYTMKSAENRLKQHAINMILRWYDSVTAKQSAGFMAEPPKDE